MSDFISTGKFAPSLQQLVVPLDELVLDPANVRKHPTQNISSIKASLVAFGQQKPVVMDEDSVVIAGNGTVLAARELGWTHVAAVKSNLSGAQRIAFAIADNRTAELAQWDDNALAQQLAALRDDESVDHFATGFDESEILAMIEKDLAIGDDFNPAAGEEQPRLDEKEPVECPQCGHKFIWNQWEK